jgi:hypothetical protein
LGRGPGAPPPPPLELRCSAACSGDWTATGVGGGCTGGSPTYLLLGSPRGVGGGRGRGRGPDGGGREGGGVAGTGAPVSNRRADAAAAAMRARGFTGEDTPETSLALAGLLGEDCGWPGSSSWPHSSLPLASTPDNANRELVEPSRFKTPNTFWCGGDGEDGERWGEVGREEREGRIKGEGDDAGHIRPTHAWFKGLRGSGCVDVLERSWHEICCKIDTKWWGKSLVAAYLVLSPSCCNPSSRCGAVGCRVGQWSGCA